MSRRDYRARRLIGQPSGESRGANQRWAGPAKTCISPIVADTWSPERRFSNYSVTERANTELLPVLKSKHGK
jgi:hypothetical protein